MNIERKQMKIVEDLELNKFTTMKNGV